MNKKELELAQARYDAIKQNISDLTSGRNMFEENIIYLQQISALKVMLVMAFFIIIIQFMVVMALLLGGTC